MTLSTTSKQGKINPYDVWDRMTPEQQREFGAIAVSYALGNSGTISLFLEPVPPLRGYEAAALECSSLLMQAVSLFVDKSEYQNPPLPDLPTLGIRTCRVCGCTANCGCEDGYHWVEDDLCSLCVGAEK